MTGGTSGRRTIRKDIHFAQIPEWVIFHEELKPLDVRLYAILCRFSEGRAFPGRKLLADKLQVSSVRTVDGALERLEQAGAVTITARFDDAGDPTSNLYTVHVTPPTGVAQEIAPPPASDCTTGSAADCSLERATFSTTPLTPASGGDEMRASGPEPRTSGFRVQVPTGALDCPRHPGELPGHNCRACGTTPRQLADQRRRDAAERKRVADVETARLEREKTAAAVAAGAGPLARQRAAIARQQLATTTRSPR